MSNISKFFVIMFALATLVLTGCTTSFTMSQVDTDGPGGPLWSQGDVTVVKRTTEVAGEKTFQSSKNLEAAKLELALEREKTRQVKAQARAANPCSSWFMAPSYCYDYQKYGGGVYINGGSGGRNTTFHSGGGGGYTRPPNRPGGTNGSFNSGKSNTGPAN